MMNPGLPGILIKVCNVFDLLDLKEGRVAALPLNEK